MKKYTFRLNKLVRDKIEQELLDNNIEVKIAPLNTPQDIIHFFKAKLLEEAEEVVNAPTVEETVQELVDCLEVIDSFIAHLKVPAASLKHMRLDKFESDGGFQNGTVVDTVTIKEGNPALDYYLQDPAKYPQVTLND